MKRTYSTAKELRAQAKGRLKNRWFVVIVAFLIVSLLGAGGMSLQYNFGDPMIVIEDELVYEYDDTMASELEELEQDIVEEDLTEEDMGEYDLLYQYQYDADHSEYIVDSLYAILFIVFFTLIAVFVVAFLSLYHIFVASPLMTGYYFFNLKLFKTRKEVSLNLLLNGFKKSYSRSAGVGFLTGLVTVGSVVLCFIPVIVLLVIGGMLVSDVVLFFAVLVCLVCMYICFFRVIVIQLQYSMCHYILAEHPNMKAKEVLRESKRMMEGHKWRLFCLRLSFIGWIFLSIFSLGIGLLWVGPYMHATETAFYRELEKGGKRYNLLGNLFH